jgi:hypothetical protein
MEDVIETLLTSTPRDAEMPEVQHRYITPIVNGRVLCHV